MVTDDPGDTGPLAPIEIDYDGDGTELSPVVWMLVIVGLVLAFVRAGYLV